MSQGLINKTDYEIFHSVGIDTIDLVNLNIGTLSSSSRGLGGGTVPTFTQYVNEPNVFIYNEFNRNYSINVPITSGYSNTGVINIFINYETLNPGGGNDGATFYFQYMQGTTPKFIQLKKSIKFNNLSNNEQILQFTFNTTGITFDSLRFVIEPEISTTGYPARYRVELLGATPIGYDSTNLITKIDKYENSILKHTCYKDAYDQEYSLQGVFVKNINVNSDKKIAESLWDMEVSGSTSLLQESHIAETERIHNYLQYDNWEYIKGNSKVYTYYTSMEADNPSGSLTNIKTITYLKNSTLLLTQTLSYNLNDKILRIITS